MNLLGIALGVLGVLLMIHSLSRQSLIRALARELRAIREREQELRIRFDDLTAKVNTTLVHVTKHTGLFDKRVGNLEDRLARSVPQEPAFHLETEVDQEMRDRLARLEQIALSQPVLHSDSNGDAPSEPAAEQAEEKKNELPSRPARSSTPVAIPLESVVEPWKLSLAKDLHVLSALKAKSGSSLCDAMRKAFRDHRLDSIIDDRVVEQVSSALAQKGGDDTVRVIDPQFFSEVLRHSLAEKLAPSRRFEWEPSQSDKRLRTLLLVGSSGSGKTSLTVGIARILQRVGAKVLLANCCGQSPAGATTLDYYQKEGDLEVVIPVVNTKPHHVAYKAIHRAQDEHFDIVVLDTPTALNARKKVSAEVTSIAAMIAREHPYPPHETVLVLDASKTKDAIEQGKALLAEGAFSGLALTHLDELSQPGGVLEIVSALEVPLWYLSYGSSAREVCTFEPKRFSQMLFGIADEEQSVVEETQSHVSA